MTEPEWVRREKMREVELVRLRADLERERQRNAALLAGNRRLQQRVSHLTASRSQIKRMWREATAHSR